LISSFARVDLNASDFNGVAPILAAAYAGSYEIVQLLTGMPGINLEVRDSAGVFFFINFGRFFLLELLQ
jgi:ankyrin repeat protein